VVRVTRDSVASQNVSKEEGRWIHRSELNTLPLTGLTRKILRALEIIQ